MDGFLCVNLLQMSTPVIPRIKECGTGANNRTGRCQTRVQRSTVIV